MPEPAQPAPSKIPGSFANLLASVAARLQDDGWDDSALADDISTITYEQALRAARRDRIPPPATRQLLDTDPDKPASLPISPCKDPCHTGPKKSKSASVTIRLTTEEHAQLQERASAAHLSVSAYLRSCIFEAESLRSQVKQALAQMQSASPQATSRTSAETAQNDWRKRFFPAWSRRRTIDS
jgi:hypothetical protein